MCIDIEPTALVGHSVRVWWDGDKRMFQGRVMGFNAASWTHTVRACTCRKAFRPPPRRRRVGLLFILAALSHACLEILFNLVALPEWIP